MITYTIYLLSVVLDTNVALMNPHLEAFSKHLQCFLGLELLPTVIFNKRRIMIKERTKLSLGRFNHSRQKNERAAQIQQKLYKSGYSYVMCV